MKVDWALPCRYVEVGADNLYTVVGGGVDTFTAPSFPTEVAVMLLVRMSSETHEDGGEHRLVLRVLGPDMMPTGDTIETLFPLNRNPHAIDGWQQALYFPTRLQFVAPAPGIYTIEISVDGDLTTVALITRTAA